MNSHSARAEVLRIHRIKDRCRVLGPGTRAIVWFQGCALDCPGCIAWEMNRSRDFEKYSPESLSDRILNIRGIEGITLSGGDPFDQPLPALEEFLKRIRALSDLTVMCYTGRTIEELLSDKELRRDIHRRILRLCDLVIDGRYVEERNDGSLWRGSSNQKIWNVSNRYSTQDLERGSEGGRSVEIEFTAENEFLMAGIPAPGFLTKLRRSLDKKGIEIALRDACPTTSSYHHQTHLQRREEETI